MTDILIVFVTCGSSKQAEDMAKTLVTEKLAACVNVLPGIRSCFEWKDKIDWAEEVLLLIKTTKQRYQDLESRVRELHSYEVPEILAVPIEAGLKPYLEWVHSKASVL
jgi:periplasmic divalent cation tolerance protein